MDDCPMREHGPEPAGAFHTGDGGMVLYQYAQSIASYFLALAEFGLSVYGVREIGKAREDKEKVNQIFTELFIINFWSTTCALGAYGGCIFFIEGMKEQIHLFLACGLSIFLHYFCVDWLYQGKENYKDIVVRNLIVKLASLAAMVVFVRSPEDFAGYALIISMAVGGSYVWNMIYARKYARFVGRGLHVRNHIKPLTSMAAVGFIRVFYGKIETIILGMMSSEAVTGYYNYANTIYYTLVQLCISIPNVFFSRLSFDHENNREEFQSLLQLGINLLIFITVPACAGIYLLASPLILVLFGENFSHSAGTLRILAVLIPVISLEEFLCHQARLAAGDGEERIPAYMAASAGKIIMDFFLIPVLADKGAAAVSVISEWMVSAYLIYKTRQRICFQVPWRELRQAAVSTAVMAGVVKGITELGHWELFQCGVGIAGGILVYGAVNIVMKNELMLAGLERFREWARRG